MPLIDFIFDLVSAKSELLVALSALLLAVSQGMLQRRHNKLSVAPHLTFDLITSNTTPQIRLILSNHGIGPAIVRRFSVYFDGVLIERQPGFWLHIGSNLRIDFVWGGGKIFSEGDSLTAGQSCELFEFHTVKADKDESFINELAHSEINRIVVKIEYESFYGEKFETTSLSATSIANA